MATATLGAINLTEIDDADANTDWTEFTTADPDIKKEGTNAMSGILRSDLDEGYVDKGSPISCSGEHLRLWINTINVPYMETETNGGYEVFVYDGTNTDYVTIFSSDDYFGGWFNMVVDCALFTTVTPANVDRWGIRANHHTNAKNATNTWVDYFRYMDGYYITGGTGSGSNAVHLSDVAEADRISGATLIGYGIVLESEGVYFSYGKIQLGNGATTTYFEMDGDVLIFTDQPVADGLYAINGNGSGADILITGSTIKSAGTAADTRFDFDMSTGSPGSVEITDNVFRRGGDFTYASGQTVTGNSYNDCGQITAGGADLTGSVIKGYEGSTGTAALYYNVNADPDGELDDMEFTKGTATTHAIELGSNTPSSITLRGWTTSGYNASDEQNDSTIYNNSGKAITIYITGGTGNFSVRNGSGASTSVVISPVTLTITVKDGDTKAVISGVQVFVEVTSGVNFPYNASVNITGSGTTATVTHATHGLETGDWVNIQGANEDVYNGRYQITYSDGSTYTYTTNETIGSSPATGTITATFVMLAGTTDGSGEISDSWSISFDQPFSGWARKQTSSPYYKQFDIVDTLASDADKDITVLLVSDE